MYAFLVGLKKKRVHNGADSGMSISFPAMTVRSCNLFIIIILTHIHTETHVHTVTMNNARIISFHSLFEHKML